MVKVEKLKKTRKEKEKKKAKSDAEVFAASTVEKAPTDVETPGLRDGNGLKKEKKRATELKKSKRIKHGQIFASKRDGKTIQRQTVAIDIPPTNSMHANDTGDDAGVSLLDQALASVMTENAGKQATELSRKKQTTVMNKANAPLTNEKEQKSVEAVEKKDTVDCNSGNELPIVLSRSQKKKKKKKLRNKKQANIKKADDNSLISVTLNATACADEKRTRSPVRGKVGEKGVKTGQPSTPSPSSKKKRKKRPKGDSVSPSAEASSRLKKPKIASETALPISSKTVSDDEKKKSVTTKDAASSTEDLQKRGGMLLTCDEGSRRDSHGMKEVSLETGGDSSDTSLFSRLIDSAAREGWELVEVGRLVHLFAAEWDFEESRTAKFLLETCPELVCAEFLEGLSVNLTAKQLVEIFEAGSGTTGVLMNKMASAVENDHLRVEDPDFVSALTRRVETMESNGEVFELLYPLLESLSKVRDVGALLKQLCEHWQLERKTALVQQVLFSKVFDDLDGNQDEILLDLPDLTGRLDFPNRLDQEDVDEKGNLKDFLVDDDSNCCGDEGYEVKVNDTDSDSESDDDGEGETDSEHENEDFCGNRGRNHFIEDEADVGDEDEDEIEENEERDDDNGSSSSDSE
ncbi:hypothetical protein PsorP6_004196 [Peronosclerospora sorghi]|uniref:Uncharacterized protein n=1 Tax=Peronosclerospora sorghi TaxID=230839 RepID=A0ACC0VN71_9STRA|nr:hypothetical protein PsorP6_004196 [Peronosclerospora sorghi]